MSTQRITLTAGSWTQIASASEQFIVENEGNAAVYIRFDDSAPAADAPGHYLRFREGMVRVAGGDVYAYTDYEEGATILVSTGE